MLGITFFCIFVAIMEQNQFKETVLLVDANYLDQVSCGMRDFFANETGKDVCDADLPSWIVYVIANLLCDPAKTEQPEMMNKQFQVVFVCGKGQATLSSFIQKDLLKEVDGFAFREEQFNSEFLMSVVQDEQLVEGDPLIVQSVDVLLTSGNVKNLFVVPNPDTDYDTIMQKVKGSDKRVEVLNIKADNAARKPGVLGVSLLCSMGISVDDLSA